MAKGTMIAAMALMLLKCAALPAQSFRRAGTEFNARRALVVPSGKTCSVVVTEFYHHGQIASEGNNVIAVARNQETAASKVLQLGPGDFCRLAFQTLPGETQYEIYYGGEPPQGPPAVWTSRDGLALEVRKFRACDFNSLASVRAAFGASSPLGADYVEGVGHSYNPFSSQAGPFLSCYRGYLHIATAGTYGFMTSSQDCSFLLIDDREVVSAPGQHGPAHHALRGSRKDIQLSAGPHKFEYYHAAGGSAAMMAAAWEVSPKDPKPSPSAIPGEAFRVSMVGRVPAGSVSLRTVRLVPDFSVEVAGEVPLPDNDIPLVGVQFHDRSPQALTMQGGVLWDFGDGQTSDKLNVDHVYLRPGLYTVKLTVKHGGRPVEMTNRVFIDRPVHKSQDKPHQLDDYLTMLQTYDLRTLDAVSLRQWVSAFEAKADALEAAGDESPKTTQSATSAVPGEPTRKPPRTARSASKASGGSQRYLELAAAAGKAAFLESSAAEGAEELFALARLVAPIVRDRLGDSAAAFAIWEGAAKKIGAGDLRTECEIEAADVAINDLTDAARGKKLLDEAMMRLGTTKSGPLWGKLQRVRGDCLAAAGDGKNARAAYGEAEKALGLARRYLERTAWRGAHSRSMEEFLREGQYARAAAELRQWQSEFPADKVDGYLTLLYARYWAGREKYDQAIGQAEQLQAVSADSPYVDQALLLAAECEVKRGKKERALATLHGLLKIYPGSPLVPLAKKAIARLEADGAVAPAETRK